VVLARPADLRHLQLTARHGRRRRPLGCQEACPVLCLWFQAKRGTPLVEAAWFAQRPQRQGAVLLQVLGAVDLRLALVHQHPVHQVGQDPSAGIVTAHCVL
jgi:hypothetical protein